jgi:hypothetical protein
MIIRASAASGTMSRRGDHRCQHLLCYPENLLMCGTAAAPAKIHGAIVRILSDLKLAHFPTRSSLPSRFCLDHSHCPVLAPATLAALPSTRAIPDRDVFYVAYPISSILQIYILRNCLRRGYGEPEEQSNPLMPRSDRTPPACAKRARRDGASSVRLPAAQFCCGSFQVPEILTR